MGAARCQARAVLGRHISWGSMLPQLSESRKTLEFLPGMFGKGNVFDCTENLVNNFDVVLRFFIIYSKLLFSLFLQESVGVCSAKEVFPHEENVNLESNEPIFNMKF